MRRCSWKTTIFVLLAAALTAGCVGQPSPRGRLAGSPACYDAASEYEDSAADYDSLSTGEFGSRGRLVPDVSELQPSESDLEGQEDLDRYRVMREDDVSCLAAAAAPLAQLADLESQAVLCLSRGHDYATPEATLQSQLLEFRSAEERNRAAGDAAEVYFHLAEAEASRDHIWRAIDQIDEMIYFAGRLKATTMGAGFDESALFRRKNELLDQQVQLRLTIADLNSKLRQLLGLDVDDSTPIWPDTDLKVVVDDLDLDAAVANGLAMRPDLAGLELVYSSLTTEALPSARNALRGTDPSLGIAKAPATLLAKFAAHHAEPELATRINQLGRLLTERQRAAAEEIRQAALTVNTRVRQISLANRSLESWQERLDEYVKKATLSGANSFDIADAQINLIKAERELLHAVVAWEIARVHLKKAQGIYAYECGYTAIDDTCHPLDSYPDEGEPTEADPSDSIVPMEPPMVSPPGPAHDESEPSPATPSDEETAVVPNFAAPGENSALLDTEPTPTIEERPADEPTIDASDDIPAEPVSPESPVTPRLRQPRSIAPDSSATPLTPAYVEPKPAEASSQPLPDDLERDLSPTHAPADQSTVLPPADEMDPFEDEEVVKDFAPEILLRQPSSLSRIPRSQVR
jgi:hypothetical protein